MPRLRYFLPLLLLGCQAPTPPAPTPLTLQAASAEDELPARLQVVVEEAARQLMALPASWDTAEILLEHPTALLQPLVLTPSKGSGLVQTGAKYQTAVPFGTLRPKSGYTLTVGLWNGGVGGVLVGEKQQTVNLVGGVNNVVVSMTVLPALALTAAAPTHGIPGDAVTLTGKGFSVRKALDKVTLGAQAATVATASNTSLDTAIPNLPPGLASWGVKVGTATASLANFLVDGIAGAALAWAPTNTKAIQPALAWGSGEYMLAWAKTSGGGNSDIYVQRIQASGAVVGSATKVDANVGKHGEPVIAYSPSVDRYLVAWLDTTGSPTIRTRLVNADGTLYGSELVVTTSATTADAPALCFDAPHNQFGIIWSDTRSGTPQIYGMGIGTTNLATTGAGTINASANAQRAPTLAFSPTGTDYALAWEETVGGVQRVRAQVEYGTGFLVQPAFFVDPASTGAQTAPVVALDPVSGDFLLAWADGGGNPGIRAQRVKFSGVPGGAVVPIEATAGANARPAIAYEPWQARFVVAWEDNRVGGATWDVWGQFVGIDGSAWGTNFPIRTNVGANAGVALAADPITPHGLAAVEDSQTIAGQFLR